MPQLAGRTSVVYPGLPPGFGPYGQAPDRGRYVFHLGSSDTRDNTAAAIEACRRVGVRLLVAGDVQTAADGADVEFLGRVTDEELVALYRGAAAYLDPSLFEGFGYGILEAMASGAPVIASNVTSISEVAGDAALLCDPNSPDRLTAALRRVLDEPGLADRMRDRGYERASARFTWERTGEGLSSALARALTS